MIDTITLVLVVALLAAALGWRHAYRNYPED